MIIVYHARSTIQQEGMCAQAMKTDGELANIVQYATY